MLYQRKINRAIKLATVGRYPRSCQAMYNHIPSSTVSQLTSRQLAELLDAMWSLACTSKDIGAREKE